MDRAVAYLRVSTQRQQRSGLGIEAQRAAIERFAASEGLTIISEYTEAETGKGADALAPPASVGRGIGSSAKSQVQHRSVQIGSSIGRRGICSRPDGPARAVHGRRT